MIPYNQMNNRDKLIAVTAFWMIIVIDIGLFVGAIALAVHFKSGFLALIAYLVFVVIAMQIVVAPHMATWQDLANYVKEKLKI